jgi:excisionase family DNA binding protein
MEKLLSPSDLAELVGVPIGTIYKWNSTGTGPQVLHIGKHVRYSQAEVHRWIAGRTAPKPAA